MLALPLEAQQVAYHVAEKDLIAEGIAYDSRDGNFYISSIHKQKIVRVKDGVAADFILSGQHGFMGGVGLHVDAERRILWACSGNIMDDRMQAGLFAFSLVNGALLKKVTYPLDTVRRFYNDLAILPDGSVWVTDTYGHCLWKWSLTMDQPKRINLRGAIRYPNGIVLSPDRKSALVATDEGLARIELTSGAVTYVLPPTGEVTTRDIDGMDFSGLNLLAIQNAFGNAEKNRLVRYEMDSAGTRILRATVVDRANPMYDVPTTLVVHDGVAYVIANSQLGNLDQGKNAIVNPGLLRPLVILKYRVK